ncbi:MAG: HAMP domain-containing protein [Rhodospirillales bacterium]|nr:MAG: HAMP domain-containing protein [Rhodospirillales bacterium]
MDMGNDWKRQPQTLSPITRRILAVNVLALLILVAGLLYVADHRRGLIDAELAALRVQAELIAAAVGEAAAPAEGGPAELTQTRTASQMVRRLVQPTGTRARLFGVDGTLLADSRLLVGPGGMIQVTELPPPPGRRQYLSSMLGWFDRVLEKLSGRHTLPLYHEKPIEIAADYEEASAALGGDLAAVVRITAEGQMILSVAAPVQRYKQVLGALMLTKSSREVDAAVLGVRLDILRIFGVTLILTVLLSIYLAGTIARPILRLAAAAERVRRDRSLQHTIPDYAHRRDEIGVLASALREMTEALRQRMDAIERFAGDVAHELKSPITSLNSALETVRRVNDPDQRTKLLAIIEHDIQRLDRLINDISDASRLDAELSRAQAGPVDLRALFGALIQVTEITATDRDLHLHLALPGKGDLLVTGLESRLVQVFRNLLTNAMSFSPSGGRITLTGMRDGDRIVCEVLDDGPGIPVGREEMIFRRFYSDRPRGEAFGAHSGLGLAISKQIVEAHRGSIHAENRRHPDGRVLGARFVVILPAA